MHRFVALRTMSDIVVIKVNMMASIYPPPLCVQNSVLAQSATSDGRFYCKTALLLYDTLFKSDIHTEQLRILKEVTHICGYFIKSKFLQCNANARYQISARNPVVEIGIDTDLWEEAWTNILDNIKTHLNHTLLNLESRARESKPWIGMGYPLEIKWVALTKELDQDLMAACRRGDEGLGRCVQVWRKANKTCAGVWWWWWWRKARGEGKAEARLCL